MHKPSAIRGMMMPILLLIISFNLFWSPLLVRSLDTENQPADQTAEQTESTSSTSTTSTTTPPPTIELSSSSPSLATRRTKPDYVGEILKTKETNIKKIFELLRKVQAERCEYGPDPLIDDLCPELTNVTSYASIPHIKSLRLSDVRARIIDDRIVKNLIQTCPIGEWCLGEDVLSVRFNSSRVDNKTLASNSSLAFLHDPKLFCLIESCYESSIKMYADNCVENDMTNYLVHLAPQFCNFDITNTQNDFCVENSLRLIHVAAAFYELSEEVKNPTPNVCKIEIERNECSVECKKIASSIDKLTSCCADSKLIRNFKSFNWYFQMHNQVRRQCDLPIKSICLSEGKYYLGISPKILVLSIIFSVLATTLITMVIFLVCCRQRRRANKNSKSYDMSHYYEYAYLNPGREEDEALVGTSRINDEFDLNDADDESKRLTTTINPGSLSNVLIDDNKVYVDMNNNGGGHKSNEKFEIQTNIRGLL